jgi:hypothetical protein
MHLFNKETIQGLEAKETRQKMGTFFGYLLFIVIGLVATLLGAKVASRISQPPEISTAPNISDEALDNVDLTPEAPAPNDLETFNSLVASGQSITVVSLPFESPAFVADSLEVNSRLALEYLYDKTKYSRISQIVGAKKAYLYIKVSAGKNDPLKDKESIYVVLNEGKNGGHLVKTKSLLLDPERPNEYLFDLSAMPLTHIPYSDSNEFKTIDWLDILSKNKDSYFSGFVSTTRSGRIEKVIIAYEK